MLVQVSGALFLDDLEVLIVRGAQLFDAVFAVPGLAVPVFQMSGFHQPFSAGLSAARNVGAIPNFRDARKGLAHRADVVLLQAHFEDGVALGKC